MGNAMRFSLKTLLWLVAISGLVIVWLNQLGASVKIEQYRFKPGDFRDQITVRAVLVPLVDCELNGVRHEGTGGRVDVRLPWPYQSESTLIVRTQLGIQRYQVQYDSTKHTLRRLFF